MIKPTCAQWRSFGLAVATAESIMAGRAGLYTADLYRVARKWLLATVEGS